MAYHRTGTLWEGRFKACLVASDAHLLQCLRYIELNPLRASMVADPRDYPWSSHRHNAFGEHDPLIRSHAIYRELAVDAQQRLALYRRSVMDEIDLEETDAIRAHLQRQHLYGPDHFRRAIEAQLGRTVGPRKIGRPHKAPERRKTPRIRKVYSDPGLAVSDPGFAGFRRFLNPVSSK